MAEISRQQSAIPQDRTVVKFKSAAESAVKGVNAATGWKQPLKRQYDPKTGLLGAITILVRVLSGEAGI